MTVTHKIAIFCTLALIVNVALGADTPKGVKALIDQLGASAAADRDQAEAKLVAMGLAARPALIEAMNSPDLEIKARAGRALESMRAQTARSDTWWSEAVTAPPNVNLVAGHIGDRYFFYHSDGSTLAARDVTPGLMPLNVKPLQVFGSRIGFMVLAGDRLIVTTSDNALTALNPATLETLWTFDAEKNATGGGGGQNNPVAPVAAGAARRGAANVAAVPAAAAVAGRAGIAGRGPSQNVPGLCRPTIDGNVAYVAGPANLYAIDLTTGKALWSRPFTTGAVGSPALSEDGVFVSSATQIVGFNRKTGEPLSIIDNVNPYSGPLVYKGSVVVSQLEGLTAFDIHDGHRLWQNEAGTLRVQISADSFAVAARPIAGRNSVGMNPPRLQDGTVFFSTLDSLLALNPATGETRWKFLPSPLPAAAGAPVIPVPPRATSVLLRTMATISAPEFCGDDAIVVSSEGIFAVNRKVGLPDWEFHPSDASMSNPMVNATYTQPVVANGMLEAYISLCVTHEVAQANGAVATSSTITNRLIGIKLSPPTPGNP